MPAEMVAIIFWKQLMLEAEPKRLCVVKHPWVGDKSSEVPDLGVQWDQQVTLAEIKFENMLAL